MPSNYKARIGAKKSKSNRRKIAAAIAVLLISASIVTIYATSGGRSAKPSRVLLVTSMGNITIELYPDMPITTGNFKKLVSQGVYNGTIFHRVVHGFVIQGGDPTGTGFGDPKIPAIPDEFTDSNHNYRSTVAMANSGPNTGSSQFFINLANNVGDSPNGLDDKHPVFGKVVGGMDVVDAIGNVRTAKDEDPNSTSDKPLQDVRIISAELVG